MVEKASVSIITPLKPIKKKEGICMSEDSKISKAQQKAVHKYVRNNYDRIELTVKPKGKKENIKAHAEQNGETLNSFINRAIDEAMNRDKQKQE